MREVIFTVIVLFLVAGCNKKSDDGNKVATTKQSVGANAEKLCSMIDQTGMTSQACTVSGWDQSVSAYMDTTSTQARNICTQIASMTAEKGIKFDKGWRLKIFSPYSGENTIAECSLY